MGALANTYTLFLLASLALLLSPGPAVLYILTRSIHQGRSAGVVSALGLGLGNLVQAVAAAAGLSLVLASSATLFNFVKTLGALYLIYLGFRTLRVGNRPEKGDALQSQPLRRVFQEGLVINSLNPKVAIFFLAFLPQFVVNGASPGPAWQIFWLGTSFAALGVLTDTLYALAASALGGLIRKRTGFLQAERTAAGLIYIGLGIGALFYRHTGS